MGFLTGRLLAILHCLTIVRSISEALPTLILGIVIPTLAKLLQSWKAAGSVHTTVKVLVCVRLALVVIVFGCGVAPVIILIGVLHAVVEIIVAHSLAWVSPN
jgi:hypothetical protein